MVLRLARRRFKRHWGGHSGSKVLFIDGGGTLDKRKILVYPIEAEEKRYRGRRIDIL